MAFSRRFTADRPGVVELAIEGAFDQITVTPGLTSRAEITLTTSGHGNSPAARAIQDAHLEDRNGSLALALPPVPAVSPPEGNIHISGVTITGPSTNIIGSVIGGASIEGGNIRITGDASGHISAEIHLPQDSSLGVDTASAFCVIKDGDLSHVRLSSVSGSLTAWARTERLSFRSVSGNLMAAGRTGYVTARSVGGHLAVHHLDGGADLKTTDGGILVEAYSPGSIDAQSVSGDIAVYDRSNLGGHLRIQARTTAGRFTRR